MTGIHCNKKKEKEKRKKKKKTKYIYIRLLILLIQGHIFTYVGKLAPSFKPAELTQRFSENPLNALQTDSFM